jgi:solute carrier family 66, member 2
MLVMLELCIRVKTETNLSVVVPKKFSDLKAADFWKWTDYSSYVQFILTFFVVGGMLTRIFIDSVIFVEFIGYFNVFVVVFLFKNKFLFNFNIQ